MVYVALGDLPASERGESPDFSLTSSCAVDELTLAVSLPSEDDGMIGKRSVALNERVQRGQPLITGHTDRHEVRAMLMALRWPTHWPRHKARCEQYKGTSTVQRPTDVVKHEREWLVTLRGNWVGGLSQHLQERQQIHLTSSHLGRLYISFLRGSACTEPAALRYYAFTDIDPLFRCNGAFSSGVHSAIQ